MCSFLEDKFARLGIANVETMLATATALPIADGSIDVVQDLCVFAGVSAGSDRAASGRESCRGAPSAADASLAGCS